MFKRVVFWLLVGMVLLAPVGVAWASGDAAAEGAGGLNPVAPSEWKVDLALWTVVVFVLVLVVLGKFAWRPILDGLAKRERGIAEQISQAEQANLQAKDLLGQYEKKLAEARDEVRQLIEQGRRDAEKVGQELLEKAKADAAAEQQRSLRQIDSAASAAIKDLAEHAATLACNLAGKIVGAKLNPSDHAKLIEQSVAEFASQEPSKN